jgi:hypothetical protein
MPFFFSEGGGTCQFRKVFDAEQEMSTNGRSDRNAGGWSRTHTHREVNWILSALGSKIKILSNCKNMNDLH